MRLAYLIGLARTLRALKLSPLRAAGLELLLRHESTGITLRRMAEELGISIAGAKAIRIRLEAEGYLRLLPRRGAYRVKLYEVTEKGVGALTELDDL